MTVPYTITGDGIEQVTVMVTDKEYDKSGAKILYLGTMDENKSFVMPGNITGALGIDYHVYLIAEDINGAQQTDYASKPAEVYGSLGKWGDNVFYELTDSDGDGTFDTLTISGTGAMKDQMDPPWHYYYKDITKVIIEDGITHIGDYSFWGCSAITDVSIADSVKTIGDVAFRGCKALTELNLPEGLISFGAIAFSGCSSLSGVKIPETMTEIPVNAFTGCSSFTEVKIPDSVTKIGPYAFEDCTSLTKVNIPDKVTEIGWEAFKGCTSLGEITLPAGVSKIENNAFEGCTSLTEIVIPDGVTIINFDTFKDCTSLKKVTVPGGVTMIDDSAFSGCSALTDIYFGETRAKWDALGIDEYHPESCVVHCSDDAELTPVSYMTWDDEAKALVEMTGDNACKNYKVVTADTTTLSRGWYVVNEDTIVSDRITVSGTVHLILVDGFALTASKGITVSEGNTLNIYGQSGGTGKVTATGEDSCSGIGSNNSYEYINGVTVNIFGGKVKATGGKWAAGIGGGEYHIGCKVTIYSGEVTATGGEYGAGIGGGSGSSGGEVTINGGEVNATGGVGGAGIGGGDEGSGGEVTINGGDVTAIGGGNAAGIGRGDGAKGIGSGTITLGNGMYLYGGDSPYPTTNIPVINDDCSRYKYMNVTDSEPINTPVAYQYYTMDGDTPTLHTDGRRTQYFVAGNTTTAFEAGKWYVVNSDITVSECITVSGEAHIILCDDCTLTAEKGINIPETAALNIYGQSEGYGKIIAKGQTNAAGIGGTDGKNGGSVSVYGGTVEAEGGQYGAGIGGGSGGSGDEVTIYGGNVTAAGGLQASGIGGGKLGSGGKVTVYGGEVNAKGNFQSAGIGGGCQGNGAEVTINGGIVIAAGGFNAVAIGRGDGDSSKSNGTITLGDGMYLYGGNSAHPTDYIPKKSGDYERFQYMNVNDTVPEIEPHFVKLYVGANTTVTGKTYQSELIGEMETVTFKTIRGCKFPEDWSYYGDNSGVTVAVNDDRTELTVSGTPTEDVTILIPDAETDEPEYTIGIGETITVKDPDYLGDDYNTEWKSSMSGMYVQLADEYVKGEKADVKSVATGTENVIVTYLSDGEAIAIHSFKVLVEDLIPVTGISLVPAETQKIREGKVVEFNVTVSPEDASDQKVIWSVTTGSDKVKLYSDAECTTEIGTDATNITTVYAKGIETGNATVKVESSSDSTNYDECTVVVDPDNATGSAAFSASIEANPVLGDTMFIIQLLDGEGSVIETSPALRQGETVDFTSINYSLSDLGGEQSKDFTYTIRQVLPEGVTQDDPKIDGVTYDMSEYTVTVTVTDNGTEDLTINYDGEDDFIAPVFSNSYSAEGSAVFSAKIAANDKLADNTFRFELVDNNDNVLQTSTEIKQGETAAFNTINYDLSDLGGAGSKDITYKIRQKLPEGVTAENPRKDGIAYDTHEETIVVTLINDGQGSVIVKYNGEDNLTVPEFENKGSISAHVTFKVVNGAWDDEKTADKTITLTCYEDEELKLTADDIPAVGTKPAHSYKAGSWNTVPTAGSVITEDTTYTYTYVKQDTVSYTVTFKVKNGSWDDNTTEDKTVTLSRFEYEDLLLKLNDGDIPAVGTKPADTYKAGSWDVTPSTDTAISENTTYTYTYAAKEKIGATVTFKVANGSWDNGNTGDITVNLEGYEGDTLKLASNQIPVVGTKPADTYKEGTWDVVPDANTAITGNTTYTYTYAAKEKIGATVTFKVVNGSWDNGNIGDITVNLEGYEGDTLRIPAEKIPAVGTKPADTYKEGSWDVVPDTNTAISENTTYTYTYAAKEKIGATVTFKVVNGSWDNDDTGDITVDLEGLEGDTLKIPAEKIPAVGTKPADTYKTGSWDVVPDTDTAITGDTTFTYTYSAKEIPVITIAPTAEPITYGQSLADSELIGGNVKFGDTDVDGSFTWKDSTITPAVADSDTTPYAVVFTPDDTTNYSTVETTVTVTVNSGTTMIITPPTATDITYGQTLANSVLTGGSANVDGTFTWKDSSVQPTVADSGTTPYTVVFTPEDTLNYGTAETTVTVIVNRADPSYTLPTGLTATYGDTLANVSLAEYTGWSWDLSETTNVGNVGDNNFPATFTPADTQNYNTLTGINLTVTVNKADPAYTPPTAITGLIYNVNAQALVTEGSTLDGTMLYSSDGTNYSENVSMGTGAGSYTVYWKIEGDGNHNDVSPQSISVSIAQADPTTGAPTAITGLEYTGNPQELVTAGSTSGGTMVYSLDGTNFNENIPQGIDATNYIVYYKVEGDENYNPTAVQSVNASIAKAKQGAPVLTSTNETVAGMNDGTISGLNIEMEIRSASSTDGFTAVTDTSGTGYAAGTYYVRYAEKDNFLASDATTVTINAGTLVTITFDTDGGNEIASITAAYNTPITKPDDPVKDMAKFNGWSTDIPGTMPAADMKITAQWIDLTEVPANPATCTTQGNKLHYKDASNNLYTDKNGLHLTTVTAITIPAKGHTPANAVKENEHPAKIGVSGSYDEVVYCQDCGTELSRKTVTIPALPETKPSIEPIPAPTPAPSPAPAPAPSSSSAPSTPNIPSTPIVTGSSDPFVIRPSDNSSPIDGKYIHAKYDGKHSIKLWWDGIDDTENYIVYLIVNKRAINLSTSAATSYTFKNAKAGSTYTFMVRYTTKKNGLSKASKSYRITVKADNSKPIVTAVKKGEKVKLSWNKVPNAKNYAIFRVNPDGSLVKVGTTNKTTAMIDIKDSDKGYVVKAYVKNQWRSSDVAKIK